MASNDNLARQYDRQFDYQTPQTASSQTTQTNPDVRHTIAVKGFTKLEKFVMTMIGFAFVALTIASISMSSVLTSVSQEHQDINRQIEEFTTVNSNLEQNVLELSRYDRVYQIGQDQDLSNENDRVRNVD